MSEREAPKKIIALMGNPNVGKSTLFNAMTGMHQHTGNWSGKTVGIATGYVNRGDHLLELWDLPGTYALDGGGEDERIAADCIRSGKAQCSVVVCDALCLQRSLILALQVMQICKRVIVCVNLVDEADQNGVHLNAKKLQEMLGTTVVFTSGATGEGIDSLIDAMDGNLPEREAFFEDPVADAVEIACACVEKNGCSRTEKQLRIDRLLLSRGFGIPLMLGLLLLILWLTIWGANYPSQWLEKLFRLGYLGLERVLSPFPWWVRGAIADGIYATTARVLSVMLPPMAIFFPLFSFLEDVGYLPRIAFLLDGGMQRCGGCGKQALTLCMGLGCNAVGVMGCRIIESPSARIRAILTNSMVPCNGRFPTLVLLASLFFGKWWSSLAVALCICLGVLMAMAMTGVLSRWAERKDDTPFILELPPFRQPQLKKILKQSLVNRTAHICLRSLKVAAPAGLLLWVLTNSGFLRSLAVFLDPFGSLLGLSGVILVGFLFSLPANELFIPVILIAVSGAGSIAGADQLNAQVLGSLWTWKTAVCTMVFTLLHWPCATTLMTIYSETGSKKETAAAFVLPTAVGLLMCLALNLLL